VKRGTGRADGLPDGAAILYRIAAARPARAARAAARREESAMHAFDHLVRIVARLRGPDGCPWDRAQSAASLRPYLLEEAYEVLDAIDRDDPRALEKELGDLLFQILLLARIAEEDGRFDLDGVLTRIAEKMVRRHPHVFDPGAPAEADPGSVAAWEARKARERGAGSALDGVPEALPALLRAHRVSEKASAVGFDWPDLAGVRDKVREELVELDEAVADGDPAAITHEYGDLLLALVNLGRFLPVGGEEALRTATRRFEDRFRGVERRLAEAGRSVHEAGLDELEATWQAVKRGG
jgi:MazG family protein